MANSKSWQHAKSTPNLSPKKENPLTNKLGGGMSVLLLVTQSRVLTRTSPGTRKEEHSTAQHSLDQLEMAQDPHNPGIHTCKLAWVRPSPLDDAKKVEKLQQGLQCTLQRKALSKTNGITKSLLLLGTW
jgi:hypothetical protein